MAEGPASLDTRFSGSVPEIYEDYLVPLFFEPYAADLAARVDVGLGLRGRRVLEIAAGTGVVTRALVRTLGDEAAIVATDLNPAMLTIAARRTSNASIRWQQADAMRLPFADREFDAVVCQFGVMFLPDRVAGYREVRRVLAPKGRLVFNAWDRIEANEVQKVVSDAAGAAFPTDPPRFLARTPFGYADPDLMRRELVTAGFAQIAIEAVEKVTLAPSAAHVAFGFCQGTPLRGEIEARAAARLGEVTEAAAAALAERFGRSSFENRMRAWVVSASPS